MTWLAQLVVEAFAARDCYYLIGSSLADCRLLSRCAGQGDDESPRKLGQLHAMDPEPAAGPGD